nr:MAG TPA: hypothetical protein [Crassvirales sp.]
MILQTYSGSRINYSSFLKSQIFFLPLWWPSNEAA